MYKFTVQHSGKLFEVSYTYLDTLLTCVTRELLPLRSTAMLRKGRSPLSLLYIFTALLSVTLQ